jgi:hypothetical protein
MDTTTSITDSQYEKRHKKVTRPTLHVNSFHFYLNFSSVNFTWQSQAEKGEIQKQLQLQFGMLLLHKNLLQAFFETFIHTIYGWSACLPVNEDMDDLPNRLHLLNTSLEEPNLICYTALPKFVYSKC